MSNLRKRQESDPKTAEETMPMTKVNGAEKPPLMNAAALIPAAATATYVLCQYFTETFSEIQQFSLIQDGSVMRIEETCCTFCHHSESEPGNKACRATD